MTIYQEVTNYLLKSNHPMAKRYANDDIIKMKIAKFHSDWIKDHELNHTPEELEKTIDYCLDTPELIDEL